MSRWFGKLLFLLVIFSALHIKNLSAQAPDPPSLRCVTVEANGTVTLNWVADPDTGTSFSGYHFYYANSAAGPFFKIDSLFSYTATTITLTTVNANNTILYFYIKTRDGCCSNYSIPSDTLRTIRMIVTPLSNEMVKLNWNRTSTPPLPTTSPNFILSKELTTGIYTPFRNTIDTTTNDTNIFCSKFINYKVTQADFSGCVSGSTIDGELFRDTQGPAQPLIDTVSIDLTTDDVHISWFADSSADTQGYVIYQYNGTSYDSIGSVLGINSVNFIYSLTSSGSIVETYTVAAFDSCKNLSSLAANHKTMLLETSFEKCSATISLSWTSYENMINGISRYEIWVRVNSGSWVRDAFVPSTVFTYDKILTQQGALYEFVIRVVGNDGQTASSNIRNIVADIYQQPGFLYIRSLNVKGSGVEVNCLVDPAGDIISYRLYRGQSQNGPFDLILEKNYTPSPNVTFTDAFAGADKQQIFYRISATDSCYNEHVFSNISGTVFLTAEGGNDFISEISWLDYIGWQGPTGSFNIYRVIDGIVSGSPFASVSGDTLFFTEDVSNFPAGEGNICYVVQAVEDSVNTFGLLDSAFSNVACAPQNASVYIPNAFTPGGKNPIFKPYILFGDPATYSLQIFNRWGQLIFSSSNPEFGWNGNFEDKESPSGLYLYQLIFKGFNKKEIRRTGTVMLLK